MEVKHKVKPTIKDHIQSYSNLIELIEKEIDRKSREREPGVRSLRKMRKGVISLRKQLPHVARSREARKLLSNRGNVISGFMIKYKISEELANFLKVDPTTTLSRIDISRAVCTYIRLKEDENRPEILKWSHLNPGGKRNLQHPDKKRAILPDKKLSSLLDYPRYQKHVKAGKVSRKVENTLGVLEEVKVEDDTLYYYTLQKLITKHIIKDE